MKNTYKISILTLYFLTSLMILGEQETSNVVGLNDRTELRMKVSEWVERSRGKLAAVLVADIEADAFKVLIRVDCTKHIHRGAHVVGNGGTIVYWLPTDKGFLINLSLSGGSSYRINEKEYLSIRKVKWKGDNSFSGSLLQDTPRGLIVKISAKLGSNVELDRRQLLAEILEDLARSIGAVGQIEKSFIDSLRDPSIRGEQDGTGQPATRSQSKSERGDKSQPEAEGRSR